MSLAARIDEIVRLRGVEPEDDRLHRLFRLCWAQGLEDEPERATLFGVAGPADRWTDLSPEAVARRRSEAGLPLAGIGSIDRHALGDADRLSFDLFLHAAELDAEAARFPAELMPLTQVDGVQHTVPLVLAMMPRRTAEDVEAALDRVAGIPRLLGQVSGLLRHGLASGITPPRVALADLPRQIAALAAGEDQGPLLAPFAGNAAALASARRLLEGSVRPALLRLAEFVERDYVPGCRESVALSALPDGEAWYAHLVRHHTTTDLDPRAIHETGQWEVKRIREEMERVVEETGFGGDFAAFCRFLRTDDRFFFPSAEALLAAYRDVCKRADAELPRLFRRLPRLPYGVTAVPAHAAPSAPTGFYERGSLELGRPAWFFANTFDLRSRPRWEMEALALHETVPGHHLQIALAQEQGELPDFRRHARYTAFIEGWGLYAEWLGREMGFYADPHARFGQLTYEVWRAIRLVIDTGIHALGWSREQAVRYFTENSAKAEHDIAVEVDRYIVWPGQALAYKLGELKIKDLRRRAQEVLGPRFDVRDFHDQVLADGALPLAVLEARVQGWLAQGTRPRAG